MFRLQRLEITGFKSFADYTEIIFTGNGITAVVGPNGCGKSNVSESIAWVLGEQRAKALRGAEMKDVVFQGTRQRKPSGMAEVVLHLVRDEDVSFASDEDDLSGIDEAIGSLDEKAVKIEESPESEVLSPEPENENLSLVQINQESAASTENSKLRTQDSGLANSDTAAKRKRHWRARGFALDFAPGEAVSVTRRLYLSGDSEYLLNGKACRLRDIQDLFAGTGLSGSHYAIIEQGRIGQILSAKPSDRRGLIEEAAGISKFRTRQRAAEARLDSAKTNLSRISDIVSEIDKQANSLRRQAAKTRRYKMLREEFRRLIKQLYAAEGARLLELSNELEQSFAAAAKIEKSLFAEVAEKDEDFREATGQARTAEENLAELRRTHSENALERDRTSREHRYQTEQILSLQSRAAVLKGETESTGQRLNLLKDEFARLAEEEKKERGEAEKYETDLREAESQYLAELEKLRKIELALETVRAEVFRHTTAVERFAEIERQFENNLERLRERREGLKRESVRAEENQGENLKESAELAENLQIEREKLIASQIEKQKLQTAANEARGILNQAEEILRNAGNDFSRQQNRLDALRELEQKRLVYAPQVQKLFAAEAKIGVKFNGILADELTVDEHAEKAVEMIFGNYLQSVLVESENAARQAAAFVKANNVGRIGFLVVQSPKSKVRSPKSEIKSSKSKVRISDLLGISDNFAAILTEVFPREMSAQLIENIDEVKAKSGEIYIDADGSLSMDGKLYVSGKTGSNEKNSSLLAFKREMRELETAIGKLVGEIQNAEINAEKARTNLREKEEKIAESQTLIVKTEREVLSLEMQEKSIRQEIERAARHQKVVADEINQIERELIEITGKQTEAKLNAQKAADAKEISADGLEKSLKSLTEARQKTERENSVLSEKRTLAATSGERRRAAQAALRRVENDERETASRLSRQNMETAEVENTIAELQNSIGEIGEKIAAAETAQVLEQTELNEATANLQNARERADRTSAELADLNKRSAEARNERAAFEIRQTETVARLRNINEKCSQELNLSLVELVESEVVEPAFDLEDAQTETDDLRDKLENFGAINMLALEELSESEERLEFLTGQRQDIIDSIAAAEEALREIKERSRERFKQAFTEINRNFIEFFQELFGGGRGEMTLLEAGDVLEAGIEIIAQPPGKRLQNILLLSGGEKAMAAIALVMAIFKYRPAPFCLLDEVDAPLDDANVGRFVDKIAQMSEKTQFIVITHNKRTMEAARALYGVTMQEAGVSKVVSVKFE